MRHPTPPSIGVLLVLSAYPTTARAAPQTIYVNFGGANLGGGGEDATGNRGAG